MNSYRGMNRKRLNEQIKDYYDTEHEHCYTPTPTGEFRLNVPKFRKEDVAHKEESDVQKIENGKERRKSEKRKSKKKISPGSRVCVRR